MTVPDHRRTDIRLVLLVVAAALFAVAAARPAAVVEQPSWDVLAVVDITGSMNTRDVIAGGAAESRLEAARSALLGLVAALPPTSRFGLAVFTERRPFLLIEPTPLAAAYDPVVAAIEGLDWRMGWEGDSRIVSGFDRSLALAGDLGAGLLFLSDGHEAPPLRGGDAPALETPAGTVPGLVVGVGGDGLSPIPKFDDAGREIGFYAADEVIQETRTGPPPEDASSREGWHPRNAPWGGAAATGDEHLSSLRMAHLQALAAAADIPAVRLTDVAALVASLETAIPPRAAPRALDLSALPAGLGILCLLLAFAGPPVAKRLRAVGSVTPEASSKDRRK